MNGRHYSPIDKLCLGLESLLRNTGNRSTQGSGRAHPAQEVPAPDLDVYESRHVAGLMRVNHGGEVCAQALYLGQALTARDEPTRSHLLQSAREEADHLLWCEGRVRELRSHTSYLNPLWFAGSYVIGLSAGLCGDGWSLGFVLETERQVEAHLDQHLQQLPATDRRSRAILEQMKADEIHHAEAALARGARELPDAVKQLMRWPARLMTVTAYHF